MFSSIEEVNDQIVDNRWVEWDHLGLPNSPKEYRNIVRGVLALLGHCMKCTALDGCYLVERNMPTYPLHPNCDCEKIAIDSALVKQKAKAECPIEKFTEYVFTDIDKSKGKLAIYQSFGFSKEDSAKLKVELEQQCLKNYLKGNYVLKDLDKNGQRLAIPTVLADKPFYTGWILEPEGTIRNTTPFGGWM